MAEKAHVLPGPAAMSAGREAPAVVLRRAAALRLVAAVPEAGSRRAPA